MRFSTCESLVWVLTWKRGIDKVFDGVTDGTENICQILFPEL
jgi:hypothetical protein